VHYSVVTLALEALMMYILQRKNTWAVTAPSKFRFSL